jgi:RND superfamily putative drug exporter
MALNLSPQALARGSARHPWITVGVWLVLLVVAMGLMSSLFASSVTNEAAISKRTDSVAGMDLLEERLRGPQRSNEAIIVQSSSRTVDDAEFRSFVEDIRGRVAALGPESVQQVTSFYASQNPALVSADRRTTILPIIMAGSLDDASDNIAGVLQIVEEKRNQGDFAVLISGNATVGEDFNKAAERDIARGESIGGMIALVILIIVFGTGSRVAARQGSGFVQRVWGKATGAVSLALVPLMLAVFSIIAALAVSAVVGQQWKFSFFVQNMISMMGLAVGIDYSLFILSRFREEREAGRPVLEAIDVASNTSGRAVFFSGLTVIIALLGMLIVPSTIYRSLAAGAIFVVGFAILASITLLPAIIRLFADNLSRFFSESKAGSVLSSPLLRPLRLLKNAVLAVVLSPILLLFAALDGAGTLLGRNKAAAASSGGGFWDKVASTVMRHPIIGVVSVTGVLLLAAIPYFDINRGSAGVGTLPESFESKQGFLVLEREFAGGQVYPAEIVIDGDTNSPEVKAAVTRLQQALAGDKTFGPATYEANSAGNLGLLSAQLATDPYADAANDGVRRLRSELIPQAFEDTDAEVYVTGLTAMNLDALDVTADYTPIIFAFVLGLSFLLLMMVFRSIVVPAKAIVMNLLSVGAAYGLIVLVSQKGFGAGLLGFQQVDTVEFWLPLFLFSILFGLSMDYHVFLLSRIRERYDQTGNNSDAVAYGLRSTGRLITGAALIMVAVFGGFAMGELVMLQQMGFGLGVAVLIDATIIRSILVPASMKLLGNLNWYLPPVLSWLPHFGIEGPAHEPVLLPTEAAGGS